MRKEINKTKNSSKGEGMNTTTKYILGLVALILAAFFTWYFFSIIIYVLIAAVVSFIGKPVINFLDKVKIRGGHLSNSLKAALTLLFLWFVFILFFSTLIPLTVKEFQSLENVSISSIMNHLQGPINETGEFLKRYGLLEPEEDVNTHIAHWLSSVVSMSKIRIWFGTLAGTITNLFVAMFSITFISFFFLKESGLFKGMIMAIVPSHYEEQVKNALDSIQCLLVRYFVGILLEITGVMILNTIGLSIVGLDFTDAIVIGLVAGVLNVIPYIGPLIGVFFGVAVGMVLNLDMDFYSQMLPLLIYIAIVMVITQLIDNVFFQPFIYGNSVHAHPLEIFLVILMAGSLAGIPGMILAIPAYTVIRVILKEFFSKYKLVKKITKSLEEYEEEQEEKEKDVIL